MKMEQSVPKRRHINFRHRGNTQKKAYTIHFTILRQKVGTGAVGETQNKPER